MRVLRKQTNGHGGSPPRRRAPEPKPAPQPPRRQRMAWFALVYVAGFLATAALVLALKLMVVR